MKNAIKALFEKIRTKRLASYGLPPTATEEELHIAIRKRNEAKSLVSMRKKEVSNHIRFNKKLKTEIQVEAALAPMNAFFAKIAGAIKGIFTRKYTPEQLEAKATAEAEKQKAEYEDFLVKAEKAQEIYDAAKAEAASLKAQLAEEVKRLQLECEEKATVEGISYKKSVAIRSKYAKRIDGLEESVNEDIRILLKKADRKRRKFVKIGSCSGNALPPRPVAKKLFYVSMENRNVLEGFICITPFLIGTAIFFLYPILMTIKLSFGHLDSAVGFEISWLPISDFKEFIGNFIYIFTKDTKFIPYLGEEIKTMLIHTPLIIVFSLILAMLINKNIKGKGFFRVVFFLPFLLGTGQVLQQLMNLEVDTQVLSIANSNLLPTEILSYFSDEVMEIINEFFSIIVLVLWNSGVQILLFLSGLQSISSSLYEAARVDGATEWEQIWKITVPMLSPIMLLNVVYTIVASFGNVNSNLLAYIRQMAFTSKQYAWSAAMGWVYFMCVLLIVGLVMLILGSYTRSFNSNGVGGKKNGRV